MNIFAVMYAGKAAVEYWRWLVPFRQGEHIPAAGLAPEAVVRRADFPHRDVVVNDQPALLFGRGIQLLLSPFAELLAESPSDIFGLGPVDHDVSRDDGPGSRPRRRRSEL